MRITIIIIIIPHISMDLPWDYDAWRPTAGVVDGLGVVWKPPSKNASRSDNYSIISVSQLTTNSQAVEKALLNFSISAKGVREHPHEPRFWLGRGQSLPKLGYPEIAAGDFEKTLMLIEDGLDFSPDLGEDVRKLGIQAAIKVKGLTATRSYPWTPPEQRTRNEDILNSANEALGKYSDCLEIRSSAIKGPNPTDQCFGLFAKRDIKKCQKILDEPTAAGTSVKLVSGQNCYNCALTLKQSQNLCFKCCPVMKFCTETCREIAETNYHKALCGKDFSELYEAASSQDLEKSFTARDNLITLRLLAMSSQAGAHPLNTPPISWSVGNDESSASAPWSRGVNITEPLKTLKILGVYPFAEEYDTWGLQIMWNRVANNYRTHPSALRQKIMNPLFSFFNHSCHPSTLDQTALSSSAPQNSRSVMIATKDIKAGEEVFTTYINPRCLMMPKKVRRQELARGGWVGPKGCWSKRCLAE